MTKVSKPGELKKYGVFQDGLVTTVDIILMAKFGEGGRNQVHLYAY